MKKSIQEINEEVRKLECDPLHNVEFLLEATAAHLKDHLYFQKHPNPEWTKGLPDTTRHMIKCLNKTRRSLRKDVAKLIFGPMHHNLAMSKCFKNKKLGEIHESAVRIDIRLVEAVIRVRDLKLPLRKGVVK